MTRSFDTKKAGVQVKTSLVEGTRLIQTFQERDVSDSDHEMLFKFGDWLKKTERAKIILKKKGCEGWGFGIDSILVLNYQTRFKESYVRKTLHKFRLICERYRNKPYVHLTLTCDRSFPIPYSIRLLKEGWNKLRTYLVKRHGLLPYLAVLEPHKDGYPHLHVLVFTSKYLIKQAQLSILWQKYGVGKVVYLKRYWNWGRDSKGFQYLTKYVTKFFKDVPKVLKMVNGQTNDFKAVFMKRVMFYAWLWQGRVKTYSFSRSFSGLWTRLSSGEWEFWLILWNEGEFERLLWFWGIRFDRLITEWFDRQLTDSFSVSDRKMTVGYAVR